MAKTYHIKMCNDHSKVRPLSLLLLLHYPRVHRGRCGLPSQMDLTICDGRKAICDNDFVIGLGGWLRLLVSFQRCPLHDAVQTI